MTETTSTNSAYAVGWDFTAYTPAEDLRFLASGNSGNSTRYVGIGNVIDVLTPGTMINASSVLVLTGAVQPGAFQAGVINGYVGVAFNNEITDTVNYGWVSLTTTAPTGFPVTVNQYCYENDGTGIMAGGEKIFRDGFDG